MSNELNLNIVPLCRTKGRELPTLPGLMAISPPRWVKRGREHDRLVIYLILKGNTPFTTAEYLKITSQMADLFYQSTSSLTSAMRTAAESLNRALLDRNLRLTDRGQYTIGWLVLGVPRGNQFFLLLCGAMHVFWLGKGETRHIHDIALSGRGLGLGPTANLHYSQTDLHPGDRLLFCGQLSSTWEEALLKDRDPTSLEATRRRLVTLAEDDFNAVLIQAQAGTGQLNILRSAPEEKRTQAEATPHRRISPPVESVPTSTHPPSPQADLTPVTDSISRPEPRQPSSQPSAYAIPPESRTQVPAAVEAVPSTKRTFPSSIPRAKPTEDAPPHLDETPTVSEIAPPRPLPSSHPSRLRTVARKLVGGMQAWRQMTRRVTQGLQNFIPRLLPGTHSDEPLAIPNLVMLFIAIAVPLVVVTAASMVYFRFGQSVQYQDYYAQAEAARTQAVSEINPVTQRQSWEAALFYLDKAESYRKTPESQTLRQEAQTNLDTLLGIVRMNFLPALSGGLGGSVQVSRMDASETELYLLNAEKGNILRTVMTGNGFQADSTFFCEPGPYGGYQVGSLVDIIALPKLNSVNATVLGIDANGNLLYCAPEQTPQAVPLLSPNTNWGRVTAFTLDRERQYLYVLDAPARAVWVYKGQDGEFLDMPYFFFGEQIPAVEDVIDLAVNGDDLYLLHADGHLSFCLDSRNDAVPTRCIDPAPLINPYPASQDINVFTQAHFTQMLFTAPPDSAILLLDTDNQAIFRLSPRSLELLDQLRAPSGRENPLPSGTLQAMTVSPNHILFLALDDQVYFVTDMP